MQTRHFLVGCLRTHDNTSILAGMTTSKETAADTLSLLEERIRRVKYVINGHNDWDTEWPPEAQDGGSATSRLRALERSLQSLAAKSPTVTEVLALQRKYPELLHTSSTSDVPTSLSTASLASLILAHSQLYQTVSARLSQLQNISVPDPSSAAKLIELQPRIEKVRVKQETQSKEISELRARSAKVVEMWYQGGVLGMGEQWAEWEERLRDAEILVRRREAARKREDGLV
ncbi:hypothetical protein LTR37_004103 [Vermiconidia calcicola]|uniref:Uncharacterized protein n=1 Tax=Vermiconidia calcicola TaxID=1690605 RepID=A0ACC3NQZ7_9PEZI|nr:hypothetical protein LTR37_004103 [Vermiconidia calcicola]